MLRVYRNNQLNNLIDYKTLYHSMNEFNRSRVLEKYYKKAEYKLYCGCQGADKLPIKIVKRGDVYILQSYPNRKDDHLSNCYFPTDGNGTGGSSIEAWQENSSGDVTVKVVGFNYIAEHQTNNESTGSGKSSHCSGESQRRKTFSAFAKNVLLASHQFATNSTYKINELVDLSKLMSFIYYKSKKIYFNKKLSLSKLLYRAGSDYEFYKHSFSLKKSNLNPLVVGLFHLGIGEGDDVLILLKGVNQKDSSLEFKCTRKMYQAALEQNLVHSAPLVCFAFVKDDGKNNYRAVDLAFVPVSNNGIYVESEYERKYFNECMNRRISIYKPYRSNNAFGPYMPDGIVKHTKNIIVEIYGRSVGDTDYHFRKSLKEQRYKKLKYYDYVSWSPYRGEDLSLALDQINTLLNSNDK